jgi:dienelactone hydrolase
VSVSYWYLINRSEKNKGEYMSNLVKFSQDAAAPLRNVCVELRSNGVQKIGTLGMCWYVFSQAESMPDVSSRGAAVAINDQTVDAFGMVHPSCVRCQYRDRRLTKDC